MHQHVDHHMIVELQRLLACAVHQLYFLGLIQRSIEVLLNILLGVKLVDVCFLDPGTELGLGVTFQVETTKDIALFHLLVEAIEEGGEEIPIIVYDYDQMPEILLAAEDVLEVPV